MRKKPFLAITPGDPEGIGPEITWKTTCTRQTGNLSDLRVVGAEEPFRKLGVPIVQTHLAELSQGIRPPKLKKPFVWLLPAPEKTPRRGLLLPGFQSGWSIQTAVELTLQNTVDGLVTGPIHKERFQSGGFRYPGHTEFLAALCQTAKKQKHAQQEPQVTMMLANDQLRISLVTIHLALRDVSSQLTRARLRRTILHTVQALKENWNIDSPRIGIAALNPHAGEKGLFGKEEISVIEPELAQLRRHYSKTNDTTLVGPLPADTLFAKHHLARGNERYDAIVCMYHDQGLIPVKLLDFPKTVNITLGLPMIRTSVDHGVGFDIVGTGKADPSSLQSAIKLAAEFVKNKARK